MAKITKKSSKRQKRKSKPTITRLSTSIYQLQVKGPERNLALSKIMDHIVSHIRAGTLINNENYYGDTVRCEGKANISDDPPCIELGIIKYNSKSTGYTWDILKEKLNANDHRVTAQVTDLFLYPIEHVAVLIHKNQGPNPSQTTSFLEKILRTASRELALDVDIDVMPLRVGGATQTIQSWSVLKSLIIEVIRPNPSGGPKSKRIKALLDTSDSDKVRLSLSSKTDEGLSQAGVKDLVEEADVLVTEGQGSVKARGVDEDGIETGIDSKNIQVKKFSLRKSSEDERGLIEYLYEELKAKFGSH